MKKKTATAIVAAALTLSLSVGAYASDQVQTVIESEAPLDPEKVKEAIEKTGYIYLGIEQ